MSNNTVSVGIKLTVDGKDVEGALSLTQAQLKKLSDAANGAASETRKLNDENKGLIQTLMDHSNVVKGLAAAYGLYKVTDYIKDATVLASRYETMGVVMNTAGRNAGFNASQMETYAKALEKNGISMLKARESLTSMATAGLDLAKSVELGRAAQNLAVVANQNSSETLQRLVINIQQADVVGLRHMGIVLKTEEVLQKYAAANNTTVDALTSRQRSEATLNAVLQESTKYMGIYEDSMTTAGKAMLSLDRYFENLSIKIGTPFLEGFAEGVFGVTDGVKELNKWLDALEANGSLEKMSKAFGSFAGGVVDGVGSILSGIGSAIDLVKEFAEAIGDMEKVVFPIMLALGTIIGVSILAGLKAIAAQAIVTSATLLAAFTPMAAAVTSLGLWGAVGVGVATALSTSLLAATATVVGAGALLGKALSDSFGDSIRQYTPKVVTETLYSLFSAGDSLGNWLADMKFGPRGISTPSPIATATPTQVGPTAEESAASIKALEDAERAKAVAVVLASEAVTAAKAAQIELGAIANSTSIALKNAYDDRLLDHRTYLEQKFVLDEQELQNQRALVTAEREKALAEANSGKGNQAESLNRAREASARLFEVEQKLADLRAGFARDAALAEYELVIRRNGALADTITATEDMLLAAQQEVQSAGLTASETEALSAVRLKDAVAILEQNKARLMAEPHTAEELALVDALISAYQEKESAHQLMAASILNSDLNNKTRDMARETLSIQISANEEYASTAQERILLAERNALREVEIERNKMTTLLDIAEKEYLARKDIGGLTAVSNARAQAERDFQAYRETLSENTVAKIEQANRKEHAQTITEYEELFKESYLTLLQEGSDGWDDMVDRAKDKIQTDLFDYIYKELAKPFVLNILTNLIPGGSAGASLVSGAGGSLVSSLAGASLSGIAAGAGQFIGGLTGSATGIAAGTMGPPTAAAMSGAGIAALAANPMTWAVAALAIAAKNDFWKDPDNYKRSFGGLLTGPTAGAAGSTFNVDPFASGFQAQGIAHNVDRATAEKYIDVYRDLDSTITDLIDTLGGRADMSQATLAGFGIDGRAGTAGTFLGMGGKTTEDDLAAMVNLYVSQLLGHTSGLEEGLMASVKAAGSATEAIQILKDAVEDKKEADKDALTVSREATRAASDLAREEERLMNKRIAAVRGLTDDFDDAVKLHRSIQFSIYEALGASPIMQVGESMAEQVAAIQDAKNLLMDNHREQLRTAQEEHNQKMALARSFLDYTTSLRLGNTSNLSTEGKLSFAQGNFRSLASAAQGGDLDALKRLQEAAEQYVVAADAMFASSGGRKDIVSEVLGVMDSLGVAISSTEFDPSAANAALVEGLQSLDTQLISIAVGINEGVIKELKALNVTLSELTPQMRETIVGAVDQWITSVGPSGAAMLQALSGIKGSVDLLPPDIAGYMTASMGQLMQSLLASGKTPAYIANQFTPGSLPAGAANNYLGANGLGQLSDYATTTKQIQDYVSGFTNAGSDLDSIRQIASAAVENGVSAQMIAAATGYTREQVIEAARLAGVPLYATGGDHPGGWAIVGEEGPEMVNFTGPSRIYNAGDTKAMLGGGGGGADFAELKEVLVDIKRVMFASAEFTGKLQAKSVDHLRNIDQNTKGKKSGVGSDKYANAS